MNVEAVLTTVLASSASATVVVFLSKSLLRLWLDKDLETHRANLARDSAKEIEQLRGQLERVAMEHEVRFKRMHDKRTWVIATIFAKLEPLHAALRQWVGRQGLVSTPIEKATVAGAFSVEVRVASQQLQTFYHPRAIWLERDICEQLNHVIGTVGVLVVYLEAEGKGAPIQTQGSKETTADVARELLQYIAKARTALENRFRTIIGIASEADRS